MGMSDQYDDGRYDSPSPRIEHGRYYPDGILSPELHPRYGLPIQAVRGGIKYPTPKGPTMPERLTKAQIAHELEVNTGLMSALRTRRNQLKKQMQTALPAEPPNHTMFTVSVRFKMRGQRYQFLILKSAGHYWTTGTKKDQQVFSSWEALCEWLEGPDVYDHSDLEILQSSGKAVSFTSGAIERMDPAGEPPF